MKTQALPLRLAVVLLVLAGVASAQQPVARLTDLTGVITKRHNDQWLLVNRTPVDLFDGDKVSTDRGRASVQFLGDGSTIVLDVGTNITIHQKEPATGSSWLRRVEVFAGDMWFKMTKSATQHTALVTPTAVGGLRGTEGNVHVESKDESSFTLNEGELAVQQREDDGSVKDDAPVTPVKGGETLKAPRGQAFESALAALVARPDVSTVANLLPQLDPNRLAGLADSEKPPAKLVKEGLKTIDTLRQNGVKVPNIPRVKIPW
jgi:hypothetical protein